MRLVTGELILPKIFVSHIQLKLEIWDRAQREAARRRSPTGETIQGLKILLLRTSPGECNCISLRSMRSVHFGRVNISRVNPVVSGPKFARFFTSKVEDMVNGRKPRWT